MVTGPFATLRDVVVLGFGVFAIASVCRDAASQHEPPTPKTSAREHGMTRSATTTPTTLELATFGGGCFWCMESPFEALDGVHDVVAGYSGGTEATATYEQVSSGRTQHVEVVQVSFDPSRVSYATLLQAYIRAIDPTDQGGQFADRGPQYRPVVFTHDKTQGDAARATLHELDQTARFSQPAQVKVEPFSAFYPAEDYHQDYHVKQPEHYQRYRQGSGRAGFLERNWTPETVGPSCVAGPGKDDVQVPNSANLKKRLTPLQYEVTQNGATERPFANAYWDNKKAGLYVDIVSGEPLFTSLDKFDSGTGWPSFSTPVANSITTKADHGLAMVRTEIRSRTGDSHLGHVFDDGPGPGGKRYCVNSASLRFVPVDQLENEGFAEFLPLFAPK